MENGGARKTKFRIAVHKDKDRVTPNINHHCDVDIEFGPWEGDPSVPDLISCIINDLKELGYENIDNHCIGICDKKLNIKTSQPYCRRSIYTLSINWW
jgi:hypothetical protein